MLLGFILGIFAGAIIMCIIKLIIEVYLEETEDDQVSITFENLEETEQANNVMKFLIEKIGE